MLCDPFTRVLSAQARTSVRRHIVAGLLVIVSICGTPRTVLAAAECDIQQTSNVQTSLQAYDTMFFYTIPLQYVPTTSVLTWANNTDCAILGVNLGGIAEIPPSYAISPMDILFVLGTLTPIPGTNQYAYLWLESAHVIIDQLMWFSACEYNLLSGFPCERAGVLVPVAVDMTDLELDYDLQYHASLIIPL